MRTMGMLAIAALALSGCSGNRETARGPEVSTSEVQAERGESGTPGYDADVELDEGCWEGVDPRTEGGDIEGTPGYDADVECWHDSDANTGVDEADDDMP